MGGRRSYYIRKRAKKNPRTGEHRKVIRDFPVKPADKPPFGFVFGFHSDTQVFLKARKELETIELWLVFENPRLGLPLSFKFEDEHPECSISVSGKYFVFSMGQNNCDELVLAGNLSVMVDTLLKALSVQVNYTENHELEVALVSKSQGRIIERAKVPLEELLGGAAWEKQVAGNDDSDSDLAAHLRDLREEAPFWSPRLDPDDLRSNQIANES